MKAGYKSESGAVWLLVATLAVLPFLTSKSCIAVLPVWLATTRFVARGARNRARPVRASDPDHKKAGARFIISKSMKTAARPIAVVTGTNTGIGYHTAVGLAAEGYIVIPTCRSHALSKETATSIRISAEKLHLRYPQRYFDVPQEVIVDGSYALECDNFESVRSFVQRFHDAYSGGNLQVLVNNAGGMWKTLSFSHHNPQFEQHVAVNFLGPLLLTEMLLPFLEKNGGRVVYVSSEAHRCPQSMLELSPFAMWMTGPPDGGPASGMIGGRLLDALKQLNQGEEGACGPLAKKLMGRFFMRYGTSKLLNTYHAHHVARRYMNTANESQRVYSCSLHPGCVVTSFSREFLRLPFTATLFKLAGLLFLKTPEEGAQTTLHCAMCPREELELVYPIPRQKKGDEKMIVGDPVSPYFVECANKTHNMMLAYGWDVKEAELVVQWAQKLVGL